MTNKHETLTLLLKLYLSICFNNKKLSFNLHSPFMFSDKAFSTSRVQTLTSTCVDYRYIVH